MDPVIVTGSARSGTSLTMGCLVRCGLQIGKHCGPTPWNERGQYENRELIQSAQKAYLRSIGADPAGQYPLPEYDDLVPDPTRRERVLAIVREQGVDTSRLWGFKDAKALVDWPVWAEAFPDARWVVTRRAADGVVRSCLRTEFMRYREQTYESWHQWWLWHEDRATDLEDSDNDVQRVDTDSLSAGNTEGIRAIVEALGLKWRPEEVRAFVSPDLWHFRE